MCGSGFGGCGPWVLALAGEWHDREEAGGLHRPRARASPAWSAPFAGPVDMLSPTRARPEIHLLAPPADAERLATGGEYLWPRDEGLTHRAGSVFAATGRAGLFTVRRLSRRATVDLSCSCGSHKLQAPSPEFAASEAFVWPVSSPDGASSRRPGIRVSRVPAHCPKGDSAWHQAPRSGSTKAERPPSVTGRPGRARRPRMSCPLDADAHFVAGARIPRGAGPSYGHLPRVCHPRGRGRRSQPRLSGAFELAPTDVRVSVSVASHPRHPHPLSISACISFRIHRRPCPSAHSIRFVLEIPRAVLSLREFLDTRRIKEGSR